MSVTSQLKDPNSSLNRFFNMRAKSSLDPILNQFNSVFADAGCLIFDGEIDYLMSGGAFQYAHRWWLSEEMAFDNLALGAAVRLKAEEFYTALVEYGEKHEDFRPTGSVIFYLFEQYRRTGKLDPILEGMLYRHKQQPLLTGLVEEGTKIHNTIRDIELLYSSIPTVWGDLRDPNAEYIASPTFDGSESVGGADACFIHNHVMWDIKVTKKCAPLTRELLLQQITYVMLDYSDEYEISHIAWYYPRQQRKIVVPVGRLIKDVEGLRQDWQKWHAAYSYALDVRMPNAHEGEDYFWRKVKRNYDEPDFEYDGRDEFEDYVLDDKGWPGYHRGLDYPDFPEDAF